MAHRHGEGRPSPRAPLDSQPAAAADAGFGMLSDPSDGQRRARTRIAAQDRHHRVCRELERLAPLRRYYGPQRLLNAPLGQLDARGRWAA
jgi:hypothetical protein